MQNLPEGAQYINSLNNRFYKQDGENKENLVFREGVWHLSHIETTDLASLTFIEEVV